MDALTSDELLSSEKFLNWKAPSSGPTFKGLSFKGPSFTYQGPTFRNHVANEERHYTIAEIAKQWGISTDLARDTFRDEPGVLRFERPGTRVKRHYSTMRVPESVMIRVHTKLTQK